MMRLCAGALASALLAACMPDPGNAPVDSEKRVAPAASEAARDDIEGRYVVAYVDGAPPTINIRGYEPTVTIGQERIHFQSQCIYADWTYQRTGETIATQPYYEPGSAMCARALAPGEVAIQEGFENARTVRRIRGGLYLEGGGRRLELHRIIDEAARAARAVDLAGEWQVSELDGQAMERVAIALSANHDQIWWEPACASQYRDYTIEGRRFDSDPVDLSGREVCDIGFPEELPRIWAAMDAADTIERTPGNGVRLSGNGRSVTLSPQQ